jgi:endonuclease/exonuclease/phosphatase family metal-dependent hydrolase
MRLLSYNIHKGIGGRDRRYRLARIIGVIEEENPDLVCLQEVDQNLRRTRFDDQPRLLAEYFHAAGVHFQLNVAIRAGGYGNLILARWPIIEQHQVALRHGRRKPRGAQLAAVETPEGPLLLVNWHLGLAEHERRWQVAHLLAHPTFRALADLPTIINGDYNDWRNRLGRLTFTPAGFHHVTAPPSRFRSFPATLAIGSLDKAYVRGPIQVRHARIVHSAPARAASDHLPLVVDFHLD